ncbi:hypothetical protein XM38_033380 [Halomicronema hongdechloris C2206]|uniref:PBP domain-containing protein n=1 Tax=Halomicronema hongdechloris C2206 TaxID=1641165 RepID=A0A1Z3HPZ3_9CYAN|nr:substrate-binding domain-containing protein [Halomicronema hongdechloris]ASC72381.1 hypothetical protein XM38_033380 [Halomicronema hongdechloris C2206]
MGHGWSLGQRPVAIGLLLSLSTIPFGGVRTVVLASDNTYLVVPESAEPEAAAGESPPTARETLQGTTLRIGGSDTLASLNQQLGRAFTQQYPGTTVDLVTLAPDAALAAVAAGTLDLAAVQRPLTPQERLQGLRSHPIQGNLAYVYAGPDPDPVLRAFFGVATDPLNREAIDQALASTPASGDAGLATADEAAAGEGGSDTSEAEPPTSQPPDPGEETAPEPTGPGPDDPVSTAPGTTAEAPTADTSPGQWWWLLLPLLGLPLLYWLWRSRRSAPSTQAPLSYSPPGPSLQGPSLQGPSLQG